MLASPASPTEILAGQLLGRMALALFQALLIYAVGTLAFGVRWGNPLAIGVLILLFAMVGSGVATLGAALFRTPEQATAIGPPVGIALGMLGGCMWPLSIVPPVMQAAGHVTPQAWAMDAFVKVMAGQAGLAAIGSDLLVLLAFVAVLVPLGSWRLRRTLMAA
jgi:ABC-2 type transport system permease protein